MWLPYFVASILIALVSCADNEYLPPSNGYNYDRPSIPFPTNQREQQPSPFRPPAPSPRPNYVPPSTGGQQLEDHHEDHHHHEPGMPFDFSYSVNGEGNDYSHNAVSDGDITRGEYRVALPDGRTQIVKYTADWKNGFNAEVTYEGEARYPEPPAGGYGAPSGGPGQAYVPPSQGGGYQYRK